MKEIGVHKRPEKKLIQKRLNWWGKKGTNVWWWVRKKNPQLLLGLGGILHTWWHLGDGSREKNGQDIQASTDFQLLITNAEERKKSSANVFSGGGGQKLSISSDSHKRAKRMVLNLQINQKHCPRNWKGVIKRQTFVHKYKGDSLTFPHRGTASWDKYAHNNDSRANWNLEMWVDKLHYMLI